MEKIKAVTIAENEDYLRQVSLPVEKNDPNLKEDIAKIEKYCKENEVLAMASVQISIPKRLVYLKNTNLEILEKINDGSANEDEQKYNEARVLINPVVLEKEGLTTYWEACASCMDYVGLVKRPYKIVVEYETEKREKRKETFTGFEATVLSHELDHLDGILHIDIAEEVRNIPVEERKALRKKEGYTILSETGNYEELKEKK